MTNAEISNLMPMIRLFKISQDDDGSEAEVEFNFESHASNDEVQNFIGDKNKRGFGVGIKDFTFSYVGSNPFSAKKSIEANKNMHIIGIKNVELTIGSCQNRN